MSGGAPDRAARLRAFIGAEAKAAGFETFGIVRPDAIPQAPSRLAEFVEHHRHGTMQWMEERGAERSSPSILWPQVRSIIMLGMNYGPQSDPRDLLDEPDKGLISVYARNRDYHDIIKGRLKNLAGRLIARIGGDVKVFVDTAPVMEKPLAAAAGLGWQGKHTNLVSREYGSWLFLGSIFTTEEIEPDEMQTDHCGNCRACLSACPTNAFPAPYQIDARRCISYLTIENKGPIPAEFRSAIGNHIYGCDDCLAACPWNKFAKTASEARLIARDDLNEPSLEFLLELDDPAFRTLFSGSPIKRIGRDRFLRNVLVAAGNSGDRALVEKCTKLLGDESELVRGSAIWALSQLLHRSELEALFSHYGTAEHDPSVLVEWQDALSVEERSA